MNQTYEPPVGKPHWKNYTSYPLLYLAWGSRNYSETPLFPRKRADWIYVAPTKNPVVAEIDGSRIVIHAGNCLIIAPGCESGFIASPDGKCEIQTWVWQTPPTFAELHPKRSHHQLIKLHESQASQLKDIHRKCISEVQSPDQYTIEALTILHQQLDLQLVRQHKSKNIRQTPSDQRLSLAINWLQQHPDNHAPSAGLCDYLQISPSTLARLFKSRLNYGPRDAALRLRISEAKRLIHDEEWSVKATAYYLGYKHPNDLSRALNSKNAI